MKRITVLLIAVILILSLSTVVSAKKVASDDLRIATFDLYKYFRFPYLNGYIYVFPERFSTFYGKYPDAKDYDVYRGKTYQAEANDFEYINAKNIFDYYGDDENIKPLQAPFIYYAIHDLNIKREDFVTVYKDTIYKSLSEEDLDVLFSDDVVAVRKHFKSPAVFFCEEDGYVYNLLDLMLCDEKTLIAMDENGELTKYLEYMLCDDNESGFLYDSHHISAMDYWNGDGGYSPYYKKFGLFFVDTLELLNPDKDYSIPEPYDKWVSAPQTGFATAIYAAVAVVSAAAVVAVGKKRR